MDVQIAKAMSAPVLGASYTGIAYLPPLSLGQLAADLRKAGRDVSLVDLNAEVAHAARRGRAEWSFGALSNAARVARYISGRTDPEIESIGRLLHGLLGEAKPSVLGISLNHDLRPLIPVMTSLLLAHMAKRGGNTRVVVGGQGAIREWLEPQLVQGHIDYIVYGPGEEALRCLSDPRASEEDRRSAPGLVYCRDGSVTRNQEAEDMPLAPDFRGLDLARYRWYPDEFISRRFRAKGGMDSVLMIPLRFVVGCPFRCAFCDSSPEDGVRVLSEPRTVAELVCDMSRDLGTPCFFFLSDCANFDRRWFREFCLSLERSRAGILWTDCFRATGMDWDTCCLARRSGCIAATFGLETASPRLLRYVEKGVRVGEVEAAVTAAHRAGIWTGVEIIAGLPTETPDDTKATVDFLNRNRLSLDAVYLNPFRLMRHSRFGMEPDRYRLTNLRDTGAAERGRIAAAYSGMKVECAFDESGGPDWNTKVHQIAASYNQVRSAIPEDLWGQPYQELWPALYYLYSHGWTNDRIRSGLAGYASHVWQNSRLRDFWLGKRATPAAGVMLSESHASEMADGSSEKGNPK